ncbi:MAG: outer membrane beta-barrel protein [Ginsengibacter sp.]
MEQNNFEKNVRQKLEELKIPPSDAVWANVEKQLGKKEKGKKVILIFFVLLIFLLTGGYWLLNSSKNNPTQNHQVTQLLKDSKARNKEDSSFEKAKIKSGNNLTTIDSASVSSGRTRVANSQIATNHKTRQRKFSDDYTSTPNQVLSKRTNKEDSLIASSKLIKKTTIVEIENKNERENISINFQNQINIDSFLIQLESEKTIQKLIAKNTSSQKKDAAKKPGKRWDYGVTISAGSSFIGSNILERNYQSMDMSSGLPSPGNSNGGNPSYYYFPSLIKNSTAFIAGVLAEKKLSAKSKISVGISYKYYSLINKVGNKIDSILTSAQYFTAYSLNNTANRSQSYRNNFHYLEIPVSIKIQINKSKKLPLLWNGGINFSESISSNALQFNPNLGIYYNDNSIFNKTQFGLHTGLSLTLFSEQKIPLTFGPYFYYSATSLSDKGLYGAKHFSYIGIQTEILFGKK